MKKPLLIFSFFFLSTVYCLLPTTSCFSQNPDLKRTWNWYFGEYAGLDFSSGNPVAVTNSAMYNDGPGTASISDTSGNLLFYTDGKSVWNKNHQLMLNGTGLISGAGSIQRVLVIPKPLSDSIYYIFHNWVNPSYTALRYTTVNMSLQGGLGDVISKNDTVIYTNTPSLNGTTEKLAATMHKNDTDVWVMVKPFFTNSFFAFRVTSAGVDTTPVISSAGNPDNYGVNSMKFSPSGKKLAIGLKVAYGFEILDFDNATGMVSNPIVITAPDITPTYWGLEFSPDESKLYVNDYTGTPTTINLYQVDLSSGDSLTTVNSLTFISSLSSFSVGYIQMASDGKLYVAMPFNPDLGVIANPNVAGIACNFSNNGLNLAGKISGAGLPAFISNYFYDSSLVTVTPAPELQDDIICYPNPFSYTTHIIIPSPLTITEIAMMDLLGRKTEIKKKITKENDKTIVTLERNNLPAGIYFLQIKTNNKIYSQKFIITN